VFDFGPGPSRTAISAWIVALERNYLRIANPDVRLHATRDGELGPSTSAPGRRPHFVNIRREFVDETAALQMNFVDKRVVASPPAP